MSCKTLLINENINENKDIYYRSESIRQAMYKLRTINQDLIEIKEDLKTILAAN